MYRRRMRIGIYPSTNFTKYAIAYKELNKELSAIGGCALGAKNRVLARLIYNRQLKTAGVRVLGGAQANSRNAPQFEPLYMNFLK